MTTRRQFIVASAVAPVAIMLPAVRAGSLLGPEPQPSIPRELPGDVFLCDDDGNRLATGKMHEGPEPGTIEPRFFPAHTSGVATRLEWHTKIEHPLMSACPPIVYSGRLDCEIAIDPNFNIIVKIRLG